MTIFQVTWGSMGDSLRQLEVIWDVTGKQIVTFREHLRRHWVTKCGYQGPVWGQWVSKFGCSKSLWG